jgi:hypothetical protein
MGRWSCSGVDPAWAKPASQFTGRKAAGWSRVKHIGFHQYAVGTVPDMQTTWWNTSPYFDVGFYVNGAESHPHNDLNLSAAWVQSVSTQGWGLMPIWTGFQAQCACDPSTHTGNVYGGPGGCDTFPRPMSWDPNQAASQGALDALEATTDLGPETPTFPGLKSSSNDRLL